MGWFQVFLHCGVKAEKRSLCWGIWGLYFGFNWGFERTVRKYKLKEALAVPLLLSLSVCSYFSSLQFPSIKAALQQFFQWNWPDMCLSCAVPVKISWLYYFFYLCSLSQLIYFGVRKCSGRGKFWSNQPCMETTACLPSAVGIDP